MAKVLFATPIAGLRGKLGGIVYSANKAGPMVKNWYRSSNPRSEKQSQQRSWLTELPAAWRGMSGANQALWNTYAAAAGQAKTNSLGVTYYATGFNWFVAMNTLNFLCGRVVFVGAPTNPVLGGPTLGGLNIRPAASGICSISITLAQFPATVAAYLSLRFVNSTARLRAPNKMTRVWVLDSPAIVLNDISAEIYSIFGDPQVGQKVFYSWRRIHSQGRLGTATTGSVLVF